LEYKQSEEIVPLELILQSPDSNSFEITTFNESPKIVEIQDYNSLKSLESLDAFSTSSKSNEFILKPINLEKISKGFDERVGKKQGKKKNIESLSFLVRYFNLQEKYINNYSENFLYKEEMETIQTWGTKIFPTIERKKIYNFHSNSYYSQPQKSYFIKDVQVILSEIIYSNGESQKLNSISEESSFWKHFLDNWNMKLNESFNVIQINEYSTSNDYMGIHTDKFSILKDGKKKNAHLKDRVIILSIGEQRSMLFFETNKCVSGELQLKSGSMLDFPGLSSRHSLRKGYLLEDQIGSRISVVLRKFEND
jgi:hypothetical protein